MAGNFWSPEDVNILKKNMNKEKKIKFATLKTGNKNKGMPAAIRDFCKKNNINVTFLEPKPYSDFIEDLSSVRKSNILPPMARKLQQIVNRS